MTTREFPSFDRTVGITFLMFIVLGLPEGLLGLAWPSIRDQFGLRQDAIGAFILAGTLGFTLTSFNGGIILERLGAGWMLVTAALIRGVALALLFVAPSWELMIVISFFIGAGAGMIDTGANTYLSEYGSTRLLNWMHAFFGLGATFGPFLMGALFDAGLSWRWGYLIGGGLQLSIAAAVLVTLAYWRHVDLSDGITAENEAPARNVSPFATLRLWSVWFGIALFAVYGGLEVSAGQWSYTLFTEGRGVNPDTAQLFVGLYWGSFTIGRFFFGGLGERLSPVNALRGSTIGMIAGTAFIWLNPAGWGQFAGLVVLGFALAPAFPTLIAATPARTGRRHAANTIGFQIGAASVGIAIFPWLAGFLAETGSVASLGIGAAALGYDLFPALDGLTIGNTGLEAIGPVLIGLAIMNFLLHEGLLIASRRLKHSTTFAASQAPAPVQMHGD